jgi:hypothetical protein
MYGRVLFHYLELELTSAAPFSPVAKARLYFLRP